MTAREKKLIRESFLAVREEAGPVSLLFYGRLFERDPRLKPMFHGDIARQGLKLMGMLTAVVEVLDQPDRMAPELEAMGQRHTSYGVVAGHYQLVEDAFIWALGQALSEGSNSEILAAWRSLIQEVSAMMLRGAARLTPSIH